jgi:hypothetical protein
MFRADELLVALTRADIRFVIIGGIAVGVHGYVRATNDLHVVPDPDHGNLVRLAHLLADIDAEHVGLGDFSPDEFPFNPLDPDQLGQGANFRLNTSLGPLDIMQRIAGIEADPAYPAVARGAIKVTFRGHELLVAGFDHLRAMKLAAGREQDLLDLVSLSGEMAHRELRPLRVSRERVADVSFPLLPQQHGSRADRARCSRRRLLAGHAARG